MTRSAASCPGGYLQHVGREGKNAVQAQAADVLLQQAQALRADIAGPDLQFGAQAGQGQRLAARGRRHVADRFLGPGCGHQGDGLRAGVLHVEIAELLRFLQDLAGGRCLEAVQARELAAGDAGRVQGLARLIHGHVPGVEAQVKDGLAVEVFQVGLFSGAEPAQARQQQR